MLHLIWAIINVAVFVIFIGTCFKATRLIREKYGIVLAVIFVIGLLSFASRDRSSSDVDPRTNKIKAWKFTDGDSIQFENTSGEVEVILDENLINKTRLFIAYARTPEGTLTPVEGSIITTGFLAGTTWIPVSVMATKTNENDKFRYSVSGIVEWKLISATIYSQRKSIEDFVTIK